MSRRSPRSSAEVRHLVVEAATALFAERGYARVATRDIAKRADVTPSQLFAQFGTKARLYEIAIVKPYLETVSSFAERWRTDPVSAVAPEQVYRVLVNELFDVTETEPGLMTALIIAQAHEESLVSEIAPSLRQIDEALRPLEDLVRRVEPGEPVLAIRLTHGSVMAAVQFRCWLASHLPDRESTVTAMTELLTHGIHVDDSGAAPAPGSGSGSGSGDPARVAEPEGTPSTGMRERLLGAAARLFEQRGYPGVSTRSIAEAAGTSETILFRHFATKNDLFEQALTRPWAGDVADFLERQHGRAGDLTGLVADLYRFLHARRPALIALLEFERQEPRHEGIHSPVTALLDLVQSRLPAGQAHPAGTAGLVVAGVLGAAVLDVWLFTGHPPDDERVIAGLLELVHTGVKPR
jgi:AcrR family transcriptional regulator